MIPLSEQVLQHIREYAEKEAPRECCGVVIIEKGKEIYVPCKNVATGKDHFVISPEDFVKAEDLGEVIRIVHSHVNIAPSPSDADLVECERSGTPWLIMNVPVGTIHEFSPTGYQAPLVGRIFTWKIFDCFTLIRDYYKEILGINIEAVEYGENFWMRGEDLYMDNFTEAGFG